MMTHTKQTKFCPTCKTDKPFHSFNKNRARRDGLASHCLVCRKRMYQTKEPIIDVMDGEIFQSIPGYEGVYSASNLGRIRRDSAVAGSRIGRILKPFLSNGYHSVVLHYKNIPRRYGVHRLVKMAFDGFRDGSIQVNHLDGNKTNNKLENLEFCTSRENIHHALRTGLRIMSGDNNPSRKFPERLKRGSDNGNAKATELVVTEMRQQRLTGATYTELAERFGVSWSNVRKIITRRTWQHLP